MKSALCCLSVISLFIACQPVSSDTSATETANPMIGTWELISGTTIQGKDTTVTDYTKDKRFLKIIDATHFAFVGHDLNQGKDTAHAFYSSGAGTYSLKDSSYTEHLQFCSDRAWEGHDFSFTIAFQNDTLTQTGIEKVENLNINRLNIERYKKVKE